MRSPPSNPTFGFKRRGSVSGGTFGEQVPPEPPSKLILQNSLRNSDLNWWDYNRWDYGWEHVSHCLELILLILWDREVGVGGRGNLLSPQITEKRRGGLGGEIPLSPKLSAPCVTAYAVPFTIHSGEGSGRPSNWGRGQSPLPRFGGGEIPPSPGLSALYELAYVSSLTECSGEGE